MVRIVAAAHAPNVKLVATCAEENVVKVWDVTRPHTCCHVHSLVGHVEEVTQVGEVAAPVLDTALRVLAVIMCAG